MSDLVLLVPRKDTSEKRWNRIDEVAQGHAPDFQRITGRDPWFPPRPYWSMSRAVNDARSKTDATKFLITPCDYIHYPDVLERISAVLDDQPWWQPYGPLTRMRRAHADAYLRNTDLVPRDVAGRNKTLTLSAIAIRADAFDQVGGMDRFFEGYAPEDYAFHITLHAVFGPPPPPQEHPLVELDSARVKNNFGTTAKYFETTYYSHIQSVTEASTDPRYRLLHPNFTADGRQAVIEAMEARRNMTLDDRNRMDTEYRPGQVWRPQQ